MKRKQSLKISEFFLTTYSISLPESEEDNDARLNRHRSNFLIYEPDDVLVVHITFRSGKTDREGCPLGMRHRVSLSLIDYSAPREQSKPYVQTIDVRLHKGEESESHRVWFMLDRDYIDTSHDYLLCVRDETTGIMLDFKDVRFYDAGDYDGPVSSWFRLKTGGVCPAQKPTEYFRIYKAIEGERQHVRFDLRATDAAPTRLPDPEMRFMFPDGSVVSAECRIVYDDFERRIFHVDSWFEAGAHTAGVCYAELRCLNRPLGGFVFNTDGSGDMPGLYQDEWLWALAEYDREEASRRLAEAIVAVDKWPVLPGIELTDDVEDEEEKADFESRLDAFISNADSEPSTVEPAAPLLAPMDHLVGLESVKNKLSDYEKLVRFNMMRADSGLLYISTPLHAMFMGSAGTGKTTVAKMIGRMLADAGILSKGHVVEHQRATLLGSCYSVEQTNTLQAIEDARGGILFIDEAYQLYQPEDPRDPGRLVIEALLTALADETNRDWMLILAGYTDRMRSMFDMNPGLKSRIPDSNIYIFEDFTEPQLMEIAEGYLGSIDFTLSADARVALEARLSADFRKRDRNFGNARYVRNLIETEIIPAMARRITSAEQPASENLSEIRAEDIPGSTPGELHINN